MNDPKRLLDDFGALDVETRRALEAGRDVEPDRAARSSVWAALIGQLPPGAIGGAAGGGAAAGGAAAGGAAAGGAGSAGGAVAGGALGTAGLVKSIGIGVGAGLVVVLAGQAIVGSKQEPRPTPTVSASSVVTPVPSVEPPAVRGRLASPVPADEAEEDEAHEAVVEPVRGIAGGGAGRVGTVREEARLIARARLRLLHDDPSGALRLLETARQRFPNGVLIQEREALAIEALAKSGQRDAAAARARTFQQAHPESPLKDRVRDATR